MSFSLRTRGVRRMAAVALTGIAVFAGIAPASAAPWANRFQFATPAFQDVWTASDAPVAAGQASRSWTWGPQPWFDYREFYRQSPNSLRQVQYFDKARMEINNPSNAGAAGVTNGLLTVELVSGRIKIGDGIDAYDNPQGSPAQVPVAGDPARDNPQAPTYASFAGVATTDNGYRDPDRIGQRVTAVLDRAGNRTSNDALGNDAQTEIVTYNTITGHNIPRVFNDFIANGPVDGVFAFGYPITDAYWIRARVGGQERDVLVQLYERRAVTYTPSNPETFRVEMGNVGQHYFQWRYPDLGQPWATNEPNPPIAFASTSTSPGHWETWTMDESGIPRTQVTSGEQETVPYSWRRSFAGGASFRLLTDSRRESGVRRLFSINLDNFGDVQSLSPSYDPTANYFNGAVSPDGKLIVSVFEADFARGLSLQPFERGLPSYIVLPSQASCRYESPSWLADGSGLVFVTDCIDQPGPTQRLGVYRADLKFYGAVEDPGDYVSAELVNIRPLAVSPENDLFDARFARVSPDGSQVVFSAKGDLYTVGIEGGGWRQITNDPGDDGAASWSPNGAQLVFELEP